MTYAVMMCRWGDPGEHSYLLGIWDDLDIAKQNGEAQIWHRGGKYSPFVYELKDDGRCGRMVCFHDRIWIANKNAEEE